MMPRFDVAIAGAGPSGSATALRLCRLGFSVALIDRRSFPRDKLCGEYLNCGAVRELRDLGAYGRLRQAALVMRGMRLSAHGEYAEFPFSQEAWSLPRAVLDEDLRSAALAAGATEIRGTVREIFDGPEGVQILLNQDGDHRVLRSRYAVGADGMRSAVARLLELSKQVDCVRFAVGGHYAGSSFSDWLEMYVGENEYLAINPLSGTSANAVFVLSASRLREHRNDLANELSRFSRAVSKGRRTFSDAQLQAPRIACGPLAHAVKRVYRGNVVLAGDAAGFVDPFTGQGVYLALAGARLAASAIAQALDDCRNSSRAFETYARELRRSAADRERMAWTVRTMLASRFLSRRAALALRRRPSAHAPLIDAVMGRTALSISGLAVRIAGALF